MSQSIDASEAIRCLQQLCAAGELTRLNVAEIARSEGLDADRVRAILEALARAGFVEHAHGECRLIRPPASISVADVWAAVNGTVSRPRLGRALGSPATATFADLLRWESQLFDNGPIAHAA